MTTAYAPEAQLDTVARKLMQAGYDSTEVRGAMWDTKTQLESQYSLIGAVRMCTACPLRAECNQRPVAGMGPVTSSLMIVGESPGEDDTALQAPFTGTTGLLLTLIMNKLGIPRNHVYMTNIVKCHVNRPLTFEESLQCVHHFYNELAIIKPKVILSLGNTPLRILADNPDLKITRERGQWFNEHSIASIPVMPTFSPGYMLNLEGKQLLDAKKHLWMDIKAAAQTANLI